LKTLLEFGYSFSALQDRRGRHGPRIKKTFKLLPSVSSEDIIKQDKRRVSPWQRIGVKIKTHRASRMPGSSASRCFRSCSYPDVVLASLFSLRGNRPSRKKENSLITRRREKGDDGKGSEMPRGVTEASLFALIRVYEKEVGSSRIARRIVFHDRNRCIAHGARRRTSKCALRRRRSAEFTERGRAAIAVERRLSARIARAPDNNERADIPSLGGGLLRHLDMHSGAVRAGDAQDEARSRSARSLAPATRHSRRLSATITQSCRIRDP